MIKRVKVTVNALQLLVELSKQHGALMFHQSGGCCDGSAPMCFKKNEFLVDNNDVLLGYLGVVPFYMSFDQFEYWKHTQLTLDITKGRGASFSLESSTEYRFVIRSRFFTEEESRRLAPIKKGA